MVDRRAISGMRDRKMQRIGFSPPFDAIAKRKTAWDAAPRDSQRSDPIFSTGSGEFRMSNNGTSCELPATNSCPSLFSRDLGEFSFRRFFRLPAWNVLDKRSTCLSLPCAAPWGKGAI